MKIWQSLLAVAAAGTIYITFQQATMLYHKLADLHISVLQSQAVVSPPEGIDGVQMPKNLVSLAQKSLLHEKGLRGASQGLDFNDESESLSALQQAQKEQALGGGMNSDSSVRDVESHEAQELTSNGAIILTGYSSSSDPPVPKKWNGNTYIRDRRPKKLAKRGIPQEQIEGTKRTGSKVASHSTWEAPSNMISDMIMGPLTSDMNKQYEARESSVERQDSKFILRNKTRVPITSEIQSRPYTDQRMQASFVDEPRSRKYENKQTNSGANRVKAPPDATIKYDKKRKRHVHKYKCLRRDVAVRGEKAGFVKQSCIYELDPFEVLIGVSISEGTLHRVDAISKSWKDRVSTVFLGAKKNKNYNILVTGVNRDDYRSTLGKGFLGLHEMFRQYPNMKWYGLFDDDCFVNTDALVSALSAFDPSETW